MTKTNKLIHYEKKQTYQCYLFTQLFLVDLWKRPCIIVMLLNNLLIYKKILRVRQLIFKWKIIWKDLNYWNMYLLYDSWPMFIICMQNCLDNKNNSFIKWLERKELDLKSKKLLQTNLTLLIIQSISEQYFISNTTWKRNGLEKFSNIFRGEGVQKRFIDLEWVK